MMPSANTRNAKSPAIGRNASAACVEVSIVVTPFACRVAAVVKMMASAITFENPMPTRVSARMRGFGRLVGRPDQRPLETVDPLVLGLLRGLPEKQVGRYGCPEDRQQGREELVTPNDARDEETE